VVHAGEMNTAQDAVDHLLEPAVLVLCVALETIGQCHAREPLLEPAPAVAHAWQTNTSQDAVDHLLEHAIHVLSGSSAMLAPALAPPAWSVKRGNTIPDAEMLV
jgi:hypothetical protein